MERESTARVLLLQLAVDTYRGAFLDELLRQLRSRSVEMRVVTGLDNHDATHSSRLERSYLEKSARNRFLAGRRLVWQHKVAADAVRATVLVVECNPRVLSNWVWLLVRRFLGRATLVWGHVYPRAGPASRTLVLRKWMRSLASGVIVYTKAEAESLRKEEPRTVGRTFVAPNSLVSSGEFSPVSGGEPTEVLFVGRLISGKRPDLLIRAYAEASERNDQLGNLVIAGSGDMEPELEALVSSLDLGSRVRFLGWVSGNSDLRSVYQRAICAVQPGYVGLSATQSLSFGVPLLYPDAEPHAPEVDLLSRYNSIRFKAGSVTSLADAINAAFGDRRAWRERAGEISARTLATYDVKSMASGFADGVWFALGDRA